MTHEEKGIISPIPTARATADGVDIVIHQAAQILEGIYPSERMLEINTQSTISLLEGALPARKQPTTQLRQNGENRLGFPARRRH
ncbi:MAG: hypothetical protein OXI77_11255 [Chloroflexota bacterium]|nr:hypothetical protein [Chloroflexota bacterium]MDE2908682.1 hypothetical protein [Chloroflexota bacterium]